MRIVIIGGIAGGASAAAKARRINEDAEILLYEKGPHISFASCGLPYLISGEVKDEKSLLLWSAKDFSSVFNVKINPEHEVLKIDREKKDRKSTRLNSSHSQISYAVFCLPTKS